MGAAAEPPLRNTPIGGRREEGGGGRGGRRKGRKEGGRGGREEEGGGRKRREEEEEEGGGRKGRKGGGRGRKRREEEGRGEKGRMERTVYRLEQLQVVLTEGEYKGHTAAPPTSSSCTHSCCALSHTLSTASIVCSCLCHFCRSSVKETAATVPARDWREVLCVCVCGVCGVCVCPNITLIFFHSLHMTLCYADSLRVTQFNYTKLTWWLSNVSNIPAVL